MKQRNCKVEQPLKAFLKREVLSSAMRQATECWQSWWLPCWAEKGIPQAVHCRSLPVMPIMKPGGGSEVGTTSTTMDRESSPTCCRDHSGRRWEQTDAQAPARCCHCPEWFHEACFLPWSLFSSLLIAAMEEGG